jgi:hypothetical protein
MHGFGTCGTGNRPTAIELILDLIDLAIRARWIALVTADAKLAVEIGRVVGELDAEIARRANEFKRLAVDAAPMSSSAAS